MRTSLGGDVDPIGARRVDERNALGAAHVHDVQRAASFSGEFERGANRRQFDLDGPRCEVGFRVGLALRLLLGGQLRREGVIFGVHRDDHLQLRGALHAFEQRLLVDARKTVDATGAHEGLEADGARFAQTGEFVEVQRREPTPEREIDARFLLGERTLLTQPRSIEDRRLGIERHVEKGRAPARRERRRTGGQPFPIGAAGLVEMDMRINDARKNVATRGVE